MRKTALLLLLFLVALFTAAGPAQALSVSVPSPALSVKAEEAEEEENEEGEEAEDENEECEVDAEEGEDCEEAEEEAAAEECVLEDATAKVAANPGNDTVHLTIHYRAFAPAAVAIDSKLHGSKGSLHLGSSHTRFHRAGVFHDSFGLSAKEMAKAMAAREFAIDLHAANTPGSCRMELTVHRGGTRKLLWS